MELRGGTSPVGKALLAAACDGPHQAFAIDCANLMVAAVAEIDSAAGVNRHAVRTIDARRFTCAIDGARVARTGKRADTAVLDGLRTRLRAAGCRDRDR